MKLSEFPILEFDPTEKAVIEPSNVVRGKDLPNRMVVTFFREVIEKVVAELNAEPLQPLKCEMGNIQIFRAEFEGKEFGIMQAPVGAPLAAGFLEEAIARGGESFVACGSAGVLEKNIRCGGIVIPVSALRDEGTSYHYLEPGRFVEPTEKALKAILEALGEHKCEYLEGITWTTDAFYRETPAKVARRKGEGCITVEMEAAAFFAVARFRKVEFAQILYASDDVSGIEWDPRSHGGQISAREKVFWLAVDSVLKL